MNFCKIRTNTVLAWNWLGWQKLVSADPDPGFTLIWFEYMVSRSLTITNLWCIAYSRNWLGHKNNEQFVNLIFIDYVQHSRTLRRGRRPAAGPWPPRPLRSTLPLGLRLQATAARRGEWRSSPAPTRTVPWYPTSLNRARAGTVRFPRTCHRVDIFINFYALRISEDFLFLKIFCGIRFFRNKLNLQPTGTGLIFMLYEYQKIFFSLRMNSHTSKVYSLKIGEDFLFFKIAFSPD